MKYRFPGCFSPCLFKFKIAAVNNRVIKIMNIKDVMDWSYKKLPSKRKKHRYIMSIKSLCDFNSSIFKDDKSKSAVIPGSRPRKELKLSIIATMAMAVKINFVFFGGKDFFFRSISSRQTHSIDAPHIAHTGILGMCHKIIKRRQRLSRIIAFLETANEGVFLNFMGILKDCFMSSIDKLPNSSGIPMYGGNPNQKLFPCWGA